MKRALLAFAVLFVPSVAVAQETWSLPGNAAQAAIVRHYVLGENRALCERVVPTSAPAYACTQAQACTAVNAPGGASCTAGQASVAGVRVYPDTQAGREEWWQIQVALPKFLQMQTTIPAQGYGGYCKNFWATANQTVRDAECTKSSLPAGCSICP